MTPLLRTTVRYGYLPFMMLGINGIAYFIVTGAHSYAWLALLLVAALAAVSVAEKISPCHAEWNSAHEAEAATVMHALIHETQNIAGVLMIPLVSWLFHLTPGSLIGLWPREWPIVSQVLMAIVLVDLNLTMLHYLSHRFTVLWRLHAVHHGVDRLVGLNGLVRHPLHQLLDMALGTAPLILLGMPFPVAVLLAFAISVQLITQHSNVDYAMGPFRNHLSLGAIHHLHHTNWGKEGDCNFGLFLTLWDRMLGTFRAEPPRVITAGDMGIDEVPQFPASYLEQLRFPFAYQPGTPQPYKLETGAPVASTALGPEEPLAAR